MLLLLLLLLHCCCCTDVAALLLLHFCCCCVVLLQCCCCSSVAMLLQCCYCYSVVALLLLLLLLWLEPPAFTFLAANTLQVGNQPSRALQVLGECDVMVFITIVADCSSMLSRLENPGHKGAFWDTFIIKENESEMIMIP